jgi:hypothetical protein
MISAGAQRLRATAAAAGRRRRRRAALVARPPTAAAPPARRLAQHRHPLCLGLGLKHGRVLGGIPEAGDGDGRATAAAAAAAAARRRPPAAVAAAGRRPGSGRIGSRFLLLLMWRRRLLRLALAGGRALRLALAGGLRLLRLALTLMTPARRLLVLVLMWVLLLRLLLPGLAGWDGRLRHDPRRKARILCQHSHRLSRCQGGTLWWRGGGGHRVGLAARRRQGLPRSRPGVLEAEGASGGDAARMCTRNKTGCG